jgi:hypothetical protein
MLRASKYNFLNFVMKNKKFKPSLPSQCFPGNKGWEFLPEGFTGNVYSRVGEIYTKYKTHGHKGELPLCPSIFEALKVLQEWLNNSDHSTVAVRLPSGEWRILYR